MKPTAYWGFSGDVCEFYMITISCPTIFSCSVIHQIYFLHCLEEFQYRFEVCMPVFERRRSALDPIMYNKLLSSLSHHFRDAFSDFAFTITSHHLQSDKTRFQNV